MACAGSRVPTRTDVDSGVGGVTKDGHLIWPDRQLMLYAADVLSRVPGATVIYDVKSTRNLGPWIARHGGKPLLWKTGHSFIKAKMKETHAALAGEMSGHTFFGERWYGFDDGLYAAARLLEILSRHADPSAVLDALPDARSTPELQIPHVSKPGRPQGPIRSMLRSCMSGCRTTPKSFPASTSVVVAKGASCEAGEIDVTYGLLEEAVNMYWSKGNGSA